MLPIIAAAAWGIVVAFTGGMLTTIGPWYYALKKPSFQPPDWLFGPAWTVIFALAATAAVLAWRNTADDEQRRSIILVYLVNGVLNIGWSLLFFKLQRPDWALFELIALWLSILAMILVVRRSSILGASLLIPYIAWVTFAGVLNWAVASLNAPF